MLATPGVPLDSRTQCVLESRFGHEFSRVRIYIDAAAAECATDLKAQAFTVGENVVFSSGAYAPHTAVGLRLLAHELTHVVQMLFKLIIG